MDYNSFLKRDYKSLGEPAKRKGISWSRLHVAVVLASAVAVGSLFAFASHEAGATRNKHPIVLPLDVPGTAQFGQAGTLQTAALPAVEQGRWLEATVRRGDSLARIFHRLELDARELHEVMNLGKPTRALGALTPGQDFRFRVDDNGQLQELVYAKSRLESLHVTRTAAGFQAQPVMREIDARVAFASGTIDTSLFEAGVTAGLSNTLVMELANIFGWDIDFALDMRKDDRFMLIYEEHFLEGEKVSEGPILAAEFTNQGRTFRAIRYTNPQGHTDYFSPEGLSMRKAFLRTPVDFSRISSRFGKRHHPVLNKMRTHKGVDYAARRGTPIKAAGDGKIVHRGRKGGYGNTVIIQHGGRYSTLYAHMSKFNRKARIGSRVRQGQIIGYVGSSGMATGPHLHYEFRVNGVHRNPLTVRLPHARPIGEAHREDFRYHSERLMAHLDMHGRTQIALGQ